MLKYIEAIEIEDIDHQVNILKRFDQYFNQELSFKLNRSENSWFLEADTVTMIILRMRALAKDLVFSRFKKVP